VKGANPDESRVASIEIAMQARTVDHDRHARPPADPAAEFVTGTASRQVQDAAERTVTHSIPAAADDSPTGETSELPRIREEPATLTKPPREAGDNPAVNPFPEAIDAKASNRSGSRPTMGGWPTRGWELEAKQPLTSPSKGAGDFVPKRPGSRPRSVKVESQEHLEYWLNSIGAKEFEPPTSRIRTTRTTRHSEAETSLNSCVYEIRLCLQQLFLDDPKYGKIAYRSGPRE
jgi:hypothetical protein